MNLITNVATTAAPVPDAVMTQPVHDLLTSIVLYPIYLSSFSFFAFTYQLLAAQALYITLLSPLSSYLSSHSLSFFYTSYMFSIFFYYHYFTFPQVASATCGTGVAGRAGG